MTDTYFTQREFEVIHLLKTMESKEVASELGYKNVQMIYNLLYKIRNKIEKAHATVNVSNNWKDSRKNPRTAKLLRRAKNVR